MKEEEVKEMHEGEGCPMTKQISGNGGCPMLEKKDRLKTVRELNGDKVKYRHQPPQFEVYNPMAASSKCELWAGLNKIIIEGYANLEKGMSRFDSFKRVLDSFVDLVTDGKGYAFFGRYQYKEETDENILRTFAISNIAWTEELRSMVADLLDLEFKLVGGGMFAEPLRTGERVFTNNPQSHFAYKGIPDGHPPLHSFLGIPLKLNSKMIGTLGVANRPGGWDEETADTIDTWGSMLAGLMLSFEVRDMENKGDTDKEDVDIYQYTMALDYISDGVLLVDDENLSVMKVNNASLNLLGIPHPKRAELLTWSFIDLIDFERTERFTPDSVASILSQSSNVTGKLCDLPMKKHDGSGHTMVNLTCNKVEIGSTHYFVIVIQCIDVLKRSEQKDSILAFLSHEIRNPLQAIISSVEVIKDSQGKDMELVLNDIEASSNILYDVVSDTIDLIKIDYNKFTPRYNPCTIRKIIELCSKMYVRFAHDGNFVDVVIPEELERVVLLDERRSIQVIGNLVSNADKHSNGNCIQISCKEIPCSPEQLELGYDGQVIICVKDNGTGISEENQRKLFNFLTDIKNDDTSNGLGLLISRNISRAINGELWLKESRIGEGSTFCFSVPFRNQNKGHLEMEAEMNFDEMLAMIHGKRILIVDDEVVIASIIQRQLNGAGAICSTAANGLAALSCMEPDAFDIILMDCNMPVMDGYTAVAEMKKLPYPVCPIIALTGNINNKQDEMALVAGFTDILHKPVKKQELVKKICQYI